MKRYKYILAALTLALTACENGDQEFPDYDYRTVYFAYQYPVRTLVLGEDEGTNRILIGKVDRTVSGSYPRLGRRPRSGQYDRQ